MEYTLVTAVKDQVIDLEKFMELWPLLSSKDLLQALEASAGKTVSLFVFRQTGADGPVELLVNVTDGRAAVARGETASWGRWIAEAPQFRLVLEDGTGEYVLDGDAPDSRMAWVPA